MLNPTRVCADFNDDLVIFLIGMRINHITAVHRWWPVARAMPAMLQELQQQPESGFIHAEMWFGRTIILVQYWRSMADLLAYAHNRDAQHLPAWQRFNHASAKQQHSPSVGIWHESYQVSRGQFESIYVNMPLFGLAKAAGAVLPATGAQAHAKARLRSATQFQNTEKPYHE